MRHQIIAFTLIAFLLASGCSEKEDPIYLFSYFKGNGETGLHLAHSEDGLKWEPLNDGKPILSPQIGKDRLMRDPCIVLGPSGTYHMVWTTGWWDKHIGYASSEDLVHWSEQQIIPVMMHEDSARNSWAPELFYDKENEQFLIFWATTIPGRYAPVASSERERGLNHRMYVTSTTDFKSFQPTELFFNPDFSVIDATLLENNGEHVMFLKNENPNPPEKNIRITRSTSAAGPYSLEVSEPITGDYWAEGPTAITIGDYTYVYFDKYMERRYGAVRSKDLETWEDLSDSISFPSGTRHGTVFSVTPDFHRQLVANLEKQEEIHNTTDVSLFMRSDSAAYLEEVTSETGDLYREIGHHGPAVENEWLGLRLYFDQKCAIDVYSKSRAGLELQEGRWYPTVEQQENGWGADYYKVGNTVGLGGVRLWDGTSVVRLDPVSKRTARVSRGMQHSTMEMVSEDVPYMGRTVDILVRVTVQSGSRFARVEAYVLKGGPVQFVTGINYHEGQETEKRDGLIAAWGLHPEDVAAEQVELGAAIMYDPADFEQTLDNGSEFLLVAKPAEMIEAQITSANAREPELNTMTSFLEFLEKNKNPEKEQ